MQKFSFEKFKKFLGIFYILIGLTVLIGGILATSEYLNDLTQYLPYIIFPFAIILMGWEMLKENDLVESINSPEETEIKKLSIYIVIISAVTLIIVSVFLLIIIFYETSWPISWQWLTMSFLLYFSIIARLGFGLLTNNKKDFNIIFIISIFVLVPCLLFSERIIFEYFIEFFIFILPMEILSFLSILVFLKKHKLQQYCSSISLENKKQEENNMTAFNQNNTNQSTGLTNIISKPNFGLLLLYGIINTLFCYFIIENIAIMILVIIGGSDAFFLSGEYIYIATVIEIIIASWLIYRKININYFLVLGTFFIFRLIIYMIIIYISFY